MLSALVGFFWFHLGLILFPGFIIQVITSDKTNALFSSYHVDVNGLAGITISEKPQNSPNFYQNDRFIWFLLLQAALCELLW